MARRQPGRPAADPPALLHARGRSRWDLFDLRESSVVKRAMGARVDLGGIAKGWGVDRAMEEIERAGVRGGMVEVGGDRRVTGARPDRSPWSVDVRHPFAEGVLATLRLTNGSRPGAPPSGWGACGSSGGAVS